MRLARAAGVRGPIIARITMSPMKLVAALAHLFMLILITLGAPACSSGPPVAEVIGTVARIRVDVMPEEGNGERKQFFIADPKDVADMLQGIGTAQRLRSGDRFKEGEFPSLGLTFFDAQGKPHATLNFSGPIGPRNELYALAFSADYKGSLVPADPKLLSQTIERTTPPAAAPPS